MRARAHAGLLGLALRVFDKTSVVFDAAGVETALRRRNHQDPIARSEIDEPILRRDLREVEHLLDEHWRGRHPLNVFARLVQPRRGRLPAFLRDTAGAESHRHQEQNHHLGHHQTIFFASASRGNLTRKAKLIRSPTAAGVFGTACV